MTRPARESLLRRIVEQLEADDRVGAAWLAGSIGRGEDTAWSDLDLHLAVYDHHLTAFWADPLALYERIGRPSADPAGDAVERPAWRPLSAGRL